MMSNRPAIEVIDLTDSFTLANHCVLSNVIIELDDSINESNYSSISRNNTSLTQLESSIVVTEERCSLGSRKNRGKKSSTPLKKNLQEPAVASQKAASNRNRSSSIFGNCPICWDELGKNKLASTKCGHVYCLKCLKQSLRAEKKCPTCRIALRGSTAYHPLYLARD